MAVAVFGEFEGFGDKMRLISLFLIFSFSILAQPNLRTHDRYDRYDGRNQYDDDQDSGEEQGLGLFQLVGGVFAVAFILVACLACVKACTDPRCSGGVPSAAQL